MVAVRVVGGLAGDLLCDFPAAPPGWTVANLKAEVSKLTGVSIHQQRFVLSHRTLKDAELLESLEPSNSGGEPAGNQGRLHVQLLKLEASWANALGSVTDDGMRLQNLSAALRADKEIVMAAVLCCGLALEFASPELKQDRQVVMAAVEQAGRALRFASPELRCDPYVVFSAVRRSGTALQFAPPFFQGEKQIVLAAVQTDGRALEFSSDELRSDREVVLEAVKRTGLAIQFASPQLQRDPEVICTAADEDRRALNFVPEELWMEYMASAEMTSARVFRSASSVDHIDSRSLRIASQMARFVPGCFGCAIGLVVGPSLTTAGVCFSPGWLSGALLGLFGGCLGGAVSLSSRGRLGGDSPTNLENEWTRFAMDRERRPGPIE